MGNNKFDYDAITPISARALVVVEEGEVETIIDGYKFKFTIHEYSNKIIKVYLESDSTKARKMLKQFDVSFERKTLNEIHGEQFVSLIHEFYGNTTGDMNCDWQVTDYHELDYKEI